MLPTTTTQKKCRDTVLPHVFLAPLFIIARSTHGQKAVREDLRVRFTARLSSPGTAAVLSVGQKCAAVPPRQPGIAPRATAPAESGMVRPGVDPSGDDADNHPRWGSSSSGPSATSAKSKETRMHAGARSLQESQGSKRILFGTVEIHQGSKQILSEKVEVLHTGRRWPQARCPACDRLRRASKISPSERTPTEPACRRGKIE